jgi:hypothetical protein
LRPVSARLHIDRATKVQGLPFRYPEGAAYKGEQKMTVQHVHVAEGGQAIVGNVNAPTEGGGMHKKPEVQPHAQLAYAPGAEVPRQIETEREAVPVAGGARI